MNPTAPLIEARDTASRMTTIRALLAKSEGASTDAERDAYFEKAAELMAKYGIDEAMVSEGAQRTDAVVDRVIWTDRPFSKQMARLLHHIADPRGARCVSIREHTGNTGVGQLKWRHGLRVFAHEADLQMIELTYATARALALAGASKIKGHEQFGQDQKAHRESYIEGFADGVYQQVRRAQREAQQVAEIEREQREEQALVRGEVTSGRSVALVLASRRDQVDNAYSLALYGKTKAELEARSEAQRAASEAYWKEYQAKQEAAERAQRECARCQKAKSGYCAAHRYMRPSTATYREPERVGAYYNHGYRDGRDANLSGPRGSIDQGRPQLDK